MRTFLILPLSAILLGGCLTTQENPNYEYSTTYKGDTPGQNQYALSQQVAAPITTAAVSYGSPEARRIMGQTTLPDSSIVPAAAVSYGSPEARRIMGQPALPDPSIVPAASVTYGSPEAQSIMGQSASVLTTAPTDSLYGAREVSGTPGFMALQNAQQPATLQASAPALPPAQIVNVAPIMGAGIPVDYDYSRNIITADAVTTGQQLPETVRVLQGAGQNYTVKQGDTVYRLARKTCVGVNVIQSMNGLNSDFAINIGQSIRLPTPAC